MQAVELLRARWARVAASTLMVLLATGTGSAFAATYYADASASDDSGDGSAQRPKKFIGSAAALMSREGGHTLIVRPGTYEGPRNTVSVVRPGRPDAWNTVKAEVDHSVVLKTPLALPLGDHYLRFEGLRWETGEQKSITGRYVKFLRCGFKDGPMSGNTVNLGIGTNDATPGAQYILIEDAYVYGIGGRYNLLVYNADKVVLRRVVVRHQDGWSDTKGDPQAGVSLYNSTDVLTQNLLLVDNGASGYFEAALYHPSNKRASQNIRNLGAIILNTAGTAVGWDDHVPSSGNLLEDSIIWKAAAAVSINGSAHSGRLNRLTIGRVPLGGLNDWKENNGFTLTNSILWEVSSKSFKGISHQNNVCYTPACPGEALRHPGTSGLNWLPRIEPNSPLATAGAQKGPVGATVMKRLGQPGTLYDEPGFDQPTQEDLWPWPHESAIRKAMCDETGMSTGMCSKPSITQYVWEQTGKPMPASFR